MSEQNVTQESTVEQKMAETPLKRDVTPYEIAKYLSKVLGIETAPQPLYRLAAEGKIPAYREGGRKDGKWFVKQADAAKLIVSIASGTKKTVDPAW